MIVVKVRGGMANQMFPYACAKALSLRMGTNLKIDARGYSDNIEPDIISQRLYGLKCFKITSPLAEDKDLLHWFDRSLIKKLKRLYDRFKPYYTREHIIEPLSNVVYRDPNIYLLKTDKNIYLQGDFNSYRNFIDYEAEIRQEFEFSIEPSLENKKIIDEMSQVNSVAIHFRRGIVLETNSNYLVLPLDYYLKAIEYIISKVPEPSFYLFSDDPKWVKDNIKIPAFPVKIIDHNDQRHSYEDLRLMSACKHVIMANSGFSWWAAWLGKKPNQIVIAPKHFWKNDIYDVISSDFYPEDWVKLWF
jgi:hypothetical protein